MIARESSRRTWARARLVLGAALVSAFVALGAFGPLALAPNALAFDLLHELAPPDAHAPLGLGESGVDVLSALVLGARTSLLVALLATLASMSVGIGFGAVSAFIGGRVDALALRVLDILLAFPGLLLAIYFASVLPPSLLSVVLALSVTGWVGVARVVRTRAREILAREHVLAARALGAAPTRVLVAHVLPGLAPIVAVQTSYALGGAVLAEASLSFLGLGLPAGAPSWGALLDEGTAYLFVAPHVALAAGAAITLAVLGCQLFGDALVERSERV